mgnify:FL=1
MLCQTAIAQAEFESAEIKSHFNDIAFSSGGKQLVISTTRPELLPACVALFYNPDDQRYQQLKGKTAKVPLFNHEVPIYPDETVQKDKGTGLMMVCTFGDKEDVDKWFRYKLPLRAVFEKNGRMNELAGEFKGLKIKEAREAILGKLKEEGSLLKQKEIVHDVNLHERCKTEIEFLKTTQWYIKILDKKEELLKLADQITWHPQHMKVRYDHWVQNLNWDWCISRQRHFGIPIPIWTCVRCKKHVLAEVKDLPVDPTTQKPAKPCACGSTQFKGETDVLDTWATSSVTPEIVSNWASKGEYDYIYADQAFDLRPQAHDIIRTWLFYTLVKSYYHHQRIPWKNVMISGHAQDPHGRKMSKSLGNIVEPQQMIQKYSADALRFWAAGSKLGDDLPFQDKDLLTGQKFVTKLWNASKFALLHLEDYKSKSGEATEIFDKWLLSKLHKMIKESTASFENYEYAKTKAEVEQFFWHTLCDNYLEIVKDRLYNPDARGHAERKSAQYALYQSLLAVLKITAPILPHITEEIYHLYFADKEGKESIHISAWPEFNQQLVDEKAELVGDMGVDIINTVRKYKSEQQLSMKEGFNRLILGDDDLEFHQMIKNMEADLKAVLNVKEIVFVGETSLETEKFGIKIGLVK